MKTLIFILTIAFTMSVAVADELDDMLNDPNPIPSTKKAQAKKEAAPEITNPEPPIDVKIKDDKVDTLDIFDEPSDGKRKKNYNDGSNKKSSTKEESIFAPIGEAITDQLKEMKPKPKTEATQATPKPSAMPLTKKGRDEKVLKNGKVDPISDALNKAKEDVMTKKIEQQPSQNKSAPMQNNGANREYKSLIEKDPIQEDTGVPYYFK